MQSLPTIEQGNYDIEKSNNDTKISELFSQLFPNSLVPYAYIFEIVSYLEETKVNARIVPEVIRGIHNLVIGTGRGQVIIHIRKDVMNVQTREQGDDIEI